MSDDLEVTGVDTHDAGGSDSSAAIIGGMLAGMMAANDPPREARKPEPYVEPDYGTVWTRRWRVLRPVLLTLGGALIVWMFWANGA
ncbi:MAG: hypothetical protein ACREOK_00435 [Gemmatimonadaceae bacterium]